MTPSVKKILFVANHKGFSKFNAPFMSWFKQQGWQVDNASPGIEIGDVDKQFDVCITRSPFSLNNLKAYRQLKKIIQSEKYDMIHVHTPMGAVLGRLAAISAKKKGTKIIYTAHGFHFFKGAPIINWIVYYPIEKLLARYTDTLITINEEDFEFAKKHKLAKLIYHIDGVGVNINKFHPVDLDSRITLRKKINLSANDFIVLYTAQFIERKNHVFLLNNIHTIIQKIPQIKFLFAGDGEMLDYCKSLVLDLKLQDHVVFLGARKDIPELCALSDIHLSPSKQEGLAIGNIEAMASGCALIISNIRGHKEVCKNGVNGFLFDLSDPKQMTDALEYLYKNKDTLKSISETNVKDAAKFSIIKAVDAMAKIYNNTFVI